MYATCVGQNHLPPPTSISLSKSVYNKRLSKMQKVLYKLKC